MHSVWCGMQYNISVVDTPCLVCVTHLHSGVNSTPIIVMVCKTRQVRCVYIEVTVAHPIWCVNHTKFFTVHACMYSLIDMLHTTYTQLLLVKFCRNMS